MSFTQYRRLLLPVVHLRRRRPRRQPARQVPALDQTDQGALLGPGRAGIRDGGLANGADGVLVGGCHFGDCHYKTGNHKTARRMKVLSKLLSRTAVSTRAGCGWNGSPGPRLRFAEVVEAFTKELQELGPEPLKEEMVMADKVKAAFLLAGGCAAALRDDVVDLSKRVDVLDALEIVFWAPTVADVKYKDLEAMADKSIDLAFVDGMIRNTENLHTVRVLQARSRRSTSR